MFVAIGGAPILAGAAIASLATVQRSTFSVLATHAHG
jgi:hypothetical protein